MPLIAYFIKILEYNIVIIINYIINLCNRQNAEDAMPFNKLQEAKKEKFNWLDGIAQSTSIDIGPEYTC